MKAVGGLLIAVGVIFAIIVAVWTRGVGYYQHELPAIAVLSIIALAGIFGGIALYRSGSPSGPTPAASSWRPPPTSEPAAAPEPSAFDSVAALDPELSAEDLARLAAERPDLWDAIAVHPQCYPALSAWIAEASAEQASAASETLEDEAWATARTTVEDPDAAPADLASIAQHHPDLRDAVARHPAAYPELRAWITAVESERHG